MTYPDTQLLIDGQWRDALDGRTLAVHPTVKLAARFRDDPA